MEKTILQEASTKYREAALSDLKEFVAINTIMDLKTSSKEAPFGLGVRKGLDFVAELGKKLGYKVDYCSHYVTELTMGEGPLIDVYCHADVVPVSKNWKTDPFQVSIVDGKMYGRGVSDDKGPGIASLYGIKMLSDLGYLNAYKVRLIVGGNEENGSAGLEAYFHELKKDYPAYGISPDGDYPLIYAEKGIFTYKATYDIEIPGLEEFNFGETTNVVLGEVKLAIDSKADLDKAVEDFQKANKNIKIYLEDGQVVIKGKPAHGSLPWEGVNAGLYGLKFLAKLLNVFELETIFNDYNDGKGTSFDGNYPSKYFDGSSYNIGKMSYENGKLVLVCNMRLPEGVKPEDACENVQVKTGAKVEFLGGAPALINDPRSPFIQELLKAYVAQTGDTESKPLAIGGGTYARDSKNTVAFGCTFQGRDPKMHQDDEVFSLEDFYASMYIVAAAVDNLGKLAIKESKQ